MNMASQRQRTSERVCVNSIFIAHCVRYAKVCESPCSLSSRVDETRPQLQPAIEYSVEDSAPGDAVNFSFHYETAVAARDTSYVLN